MKLFYLKVFKMHTYSCLTSTELVGIDVHGDKWPRVLSKQGHVPQILGVITGGILQLSVTSKTAPTEIHLTTDRSFLGGLHPTTD